MKKKIVRKKRNVKKKIVRSKKYGFSGIRSGKEFERKLNNWVFFNGKPEAQWDSKATAIASAATRGELGAAPAHYSKGKFTPWEVIDDWKLDYYCGNALKYVCRHKHKGNPVQDIQKAIDCLIKYKQNLEKEIK